MAANAASTDSSWWVGLDRDAFQRAVAQRDQAWKLDRKRFADFVGGTLMRDAWEPRKAPRRDDA